MPKNPYDYFFSLIGDCEFNIYDDQVAGMMDRCIEIVKQKSQSFKHSDRVIQSLERLRFQREHVGMLAIQTQATLIKNLELSHLTQLKLLSKKHNFISKKYVTWYKNAYQLYFDSAVKYRNKILKTDSNSIESCKQSARYFLRQFFAHYSFVVGFMHKGEGGEYKSFAFLPNKTAMLLENRLISPDNIKILSKKHLALYSGYQLDMLTLSKLLRQIQALRHKGYRVTFAFDQRSTKTKIFADGRKKIIGDKSRRKGDYSVSDIEDGRLLKDVIKIYKSERIHKYYNP